MTEYKRLDNGEIEVRPVWGDNLKPMQAEMQRIAKKHSAFTFMGPFNNRWFGCSPRDNYEIRELDTVPDGNRELTK